MRFGHVARLTVVGNRHGRFGIAFYCNFLYLHVADRDRVARRACAKVELQNKISALRGCDGRSVGLCTWGQGLPVQRAIAFFSTAAVIVDLKRHFSGCRRIHADKITAAFFERNTGIQKQLRLPYLSAADCRNVQRYSTAGRRSLLFISIRMLLTDIGPRLIGEGFRQNTDC